MCVEKKVKKPNIFYRAFRFYVRFFHNNIYYKRTYCLNKENMPEDGTPLLVVSNHQNCLNDPLAMLFSSIKRKPYFITRGDAFEIPFAAKFFYFLGLLPSYRLAYEGEEALKNNKQTFAIARKYLLKGATIMLFPEAGHQDKHWLGSFSLAYTLLAFEAAEDTDFKTNIYILPSCNHYSDYFKVREEVMIKFGTPIELQPYYELYQSKPRTAQREVSKVVRQQIEEMMLNITDIENYNTIDFLRNHYRQRRQNGNQAEKITLPEKLDIDKSLFKVLERHKTENPTEIEELYRLAKEMENTCKENSISPENFHQDIKIGRLLLQSLACLMLLPMWAATLFPAGIIYNIPKLFYKMMPDKMFESTFRFAISILFTIPICYGVITLCLWKFAGWWVALIVLVVLPLAGIAAWNYYQYVKKLLSKWKYLRFKNSSKHPLAINLDKEICEILIRIV